MLALSINLASKHKFQEITMNICDDWTRDRKKKTEKEFAVLISVWKLLGKKNGVTSLSKGRNKTSLKPYGPNL